MLAPLLAALIGGMVFVMARIIAVGLKRAPLAPDNPT